MRNQSEVRNYAIEAAMLDQLDYPCSPNNLLMLDIKEMGSSSLGKPRQPPNGNNFGYFPGEYNMAIVYAVAVGCNQKLDWDRRKFLMTEFGISPASAHFSPFRFLVMEGEGEGELWSTLKISQFRGFSWQIRWGKTVALEAIFLDEFFDFWLNRFSFGVWIFRRGDTLSCRSKDSARYATFQRQYSQFPIHNEAGGFVILD